MATEGPCFIVLSESGKKLHLHIIRAQHNACLLLLGINQKLQLNHSCPRDVLLQLLVLDWRRLTEGGLESPNSSLLLGWCKKTKKEKWKKKTTTPCPKNRHLQSAARVCVCVCWLARK